MQHVTPQTIQSSSKPSMKNPRIAHIVNRRQTIEENQFDCKSRIKIWSLVLKTICLLFIEHIIN